MSGHSKLRGLDRRVARTVLARAGRRAWLMDIGLWSLLCLPLLDSLSSTSPGPSPAMALALGVPGLGFAVLVGRAYPLLALCVTVGLALAATPGLFSSEYSLAMLVLGYLLGIRRTDSRSVLLTLIALKITGLGVTLLAGEQLWVWSQMVLTMVFNVALPWLAGRYARQHGELQRAGWELAQRMESEQRAVADRVRLRERSRIAADMHDTLGHELSLLALRAGALEVTPELDERHRKAAEELRSAAVTATERLHDVVGVLRDEETGGGEAGSSCEELRGADVDDLVARATSFGLRVRLHRSGRSAAPPPGVERTQYRIVQESLTNVAKHAPGAEVTVRLHQSADGTEISVVNDRPETPVLATSLTSGASGGNGLVGLRERARLTGGTFTCGPADDGYAVRAWLPHRTAVAAVGPDGEGATAAAGSSGQSSESVLRRDMARRTARRRLWEAIVVPLSLVAALAVVMSVFSMLQDDESVLRRTDYEQLQPGQDQERAEELLPWFETDEPPGKGVSELGDDCRYYRIGEEPDPARIYQVCFRSGELSAKNRVPVDG